MNQLYKIFGVVFFVAFSTTMQAQTVKILKGKVVADANDLEGIYIVNLKTDASTLTEKGGYFSIPATEGDTLQFSSVQFKGVQQIVKKEDLTSELLFVKMEILTRQLDEVKVNEYKNINAVSLGIIPKGQKKYTPAERKLYTAGELHWYSPLLIPVGGMSVDGMINSISGRTAMLKKELIVERKEFFMKKIKDQFEENYFTETLKIPADYVDGFQFYLVENSELEMALNEKNKIKATFIMSKLAADYLELLKEK